jgi:hypothetical protein
MMLMYTFGGGFHQPMNPELMQTMPEDEPWPACTISS